MTPGQLIFDKLEMDLDLVDIDNLSHYMAVTYFLTIEDEAPTDLQRISHYQESIHHFCIVNRWDYIKIILTAPVNFFPNIMDESLSLCEYLIFKGFYNELRIITQEIFELLENTNKDISYARLLLARSHAGLAERIAEKLFENIIIDLSLSREIHLAAHIYLGIFQIDLGSYRAGIHNLRKSLDMINNDFSEYILDSTFNLHILKMDILESLALYEMNSGHFQKAMVLYEEVVKVRKEFSISYNLISPLVHQGVLFRRMKQYEQAIQVLNGAREIAIKFSTSNIIWVEHHLAYVFLNQGKDIAKSEKLAKNSLKGYEVLKRQRGISDNYELLGFIYLLKDDLEQSELYFQQALNIRKSIRNFHGIASSTLDLALVFWHKRRYAKAILFLSRGVKLYFQLGILNPVRIFRMLKLAYTWVLGKRNWTM